jgi:hypothetical protein
MNQQDKILPPGDYALTDEGAWFTIGKSSVKIQRTPNGVIYVDVYAFEKEDEDPLASCVVIER